jgi:peptide/nickel transport system permease protein
VSVARAVRRDRRMQLGLLLVGALVLLAVFAPLLSGYDPAAQPDLVTRSYAPPSLAHPFGTDFYSRDLFSRVLHGARISLSVAGLAVLLSVTLGTALGLAAGMAPGWVDARLMRLVDAALAVPRIFLVLVVVGLWNDIGLLGLVLILGLTSWFDTTRLVRAEVLSLRSREFIHAARALGFGAARITGRHVLPNVASPVVVSATLGIGQMILLEAGLSYLSVGIRPPTPSWGQMIAEGQTAMHAAPWVAVFPGLAIVLTVLGFSLIGDGMRRALDPRAR